MGKHQVIKILGRYLGDKPERQVDQELVFHYQALPEGAQRTVVLRAHLLYD